MLQQQAVIKTQKNLSALSVNVDCLHTKLLITFLLMRDFSLLSCKPEVKATLSK